MAPTAHPMSYARRPHERMPLGYRLVIWVVIVALVALVTIPIVGAVASLAEAAREVGGVTG